jgi:Delta24-sterol reductase
MKEKKEEFEYPIPIDAGKGTPLVFIFCILLLIISGGLVYFAWKSERIDIQVIITCLFIYFIGIITYRMTETKQTLLVPDFKGWDLHKRDVDRVKSDFNDFLKNRLPGEKASINRFKYGAHESNRVVETKYKENAFKINVGFLDQVIAFDKEKMLFHVEPGISMDELAITAMAYGVVPQVVPEFPGITVGGGIGGAAGESTGHKYGVFHNTIEEIDVITGDGILHTNVNRTNKPELFMAVCCSYGTQGVLVRAAVRVIPAHKFVRTEYYHEASIEKALDRLETIANGPSPPEFLDAVALTPFSAIVVAGYPTDTLPENASHLQLRNSRFDPWFFWYLTDLAKEHRPSEKKIHTDYLELDDYLFRFDKGAFWGGRHGMMFLHGSSCFSPDPKKQTGPNPILRSLWGWLGTTRQIYKLCHAAGDIQLAEFYIVQDLFMPNKKAAASLIEFNQKEEYNIWPLWICPFRKVETNHEKEVGLGFPLIGNVGDLMYNVGMYGLVNGGKDMNPIEKNRELEKEVARLEGKKIFYAQSFYTPEEFWSNFKKEYYDELRKVYNNEEVFHEITTKVLLSEKTKQNIAKSCEINLIGYFPKLLPFFGQMALELTTPRFIQPLFGIYHTQIKRYSKKEEAK